MVDSIQINPCKDRQPNCLSLFLADKEPYSSKKRLFTDDQ